MKIIKKHIGSGKINKLLSHIVGYSVLIFLFICLLFMLFFYHNKQKKVLEQDIKKLETKNNNILRQIDEIVSKTITAENYIKIWNNDFSKEERELKGINIDDLNKKITEIAKNSKFVNFNISFSPLIMLDDSFKKRNLLVFTTVATISFSTITDIDFFNFIENFREVIKNFYVIQEIELKRTKKIDENFLNTLNNGNIATGIQGIVKIRLYGLKDK